MTVRGEIATNELGFCLPHEHMTADLARVQPTQLLAYDYQLLDPVLIRQEVGRYVAAVEGSIFADAGRPALVELTNSPLIGRNPTVLAAVAEQLDMSIIMSCGWYREPWFDADIDRRSAKDLARQLVTEIVDGVGDTGIRPGIIGELGTDRDFVSALEERVLRAAARASRETGLSITLHSRASRVALSQLDVLREEGVDPDRIVCGHADSVHDPDYHHHLAHLGVWVEFDTMRGAVPYHAERGIRYIMQARRHGYLDRLLLSSDVGALSQLNAYGGTGYDYIPARLVELLRAEGLVDEELRMLFVDNPRRALAGAAQ
jgi:phosphotriesterase-related protein